MPHLAKFFKMKLPEIFKSANKEKTENTSIDSYVKNLFSKEENFNVNDFLCALNENPELTIKYLFYIRDRNGIGNRVLFRICLNALGDCRPYITHKIIHYIPIYGRWDDLFSLLGTQSECFVWLKIKSQLASDMLSEHPSILAKWLPSENASSEQTKALAKKVRIHLNLSPAQYRKVLSSIRKKLNIVERQMSSEDWDQINYSKVPQSALKKYHNAFLRHDKDRYMKFIKEKTKTTKLTAKRPKEYSIASSVSMKYSTSSSVSMKYTYDEMVAMLNEKYDIL